MRLIAVLIALWANRYHRHLDRYRDPAWFERYGDWLRQRLAGGYWDGPGGLALLMVPPVALVWLLQALVEDWALGLGELLLGVAILLFAQGTVRLDECLERFVGAEQSADLEGARSVVAELSGDPEPPRDEPGLRRALLAALFEHAYRHWFAPIFWYLLLGPVGVALLASAQLSRRYAQRYDGYQGSLQDSALTVLYVLDWLPARAAAFGFALAGDFSGSLHGWRQAAPASGRAHLGLLVEAGLGAVDGVDPAEPIAQTVYDARNLVSRALMVWLALTAVLILTGWFA